MATGFSDIYEYSSGGLIVPKTDKIRENIINYMYQIFGENLSLEEGTNTRKFVDNLTNLFSDLLKFSVNNVNMINFAYARGKNLDYLAEFFGIYRLKANRSQCIGKLYIDGLKVDQNTTYTIPAYSQFLSANGVVVQTTHPVTFKGLQIQELWYVFEAVEDGPIYIEPGNITPISSGLDFILVNSTFPNQNTAISWCLYIGRLSESDIEMKNRISYSRGYGSSTTNTIVNAIYKADPTISCVHCIENNTSAQKIIDGAIVPANGIAISISNLSTDGGPEMTSISSGYDLQNFSISKIETIAKAIYESVPAGCGMNLSIEDDNAKFIGINSPDIYRVFEIKDGDVISGNVSNGGGLDTKPNKYIVNVKDKYGIYHKVSFYIQGVGDLVHIEVSVKLNGYSGDNIQDDVQKLIGPYISSKIGTITKEEITSLISSSISGVFVTDVKFYIIDNGYKNTISSSILYQISLVQAFNSNNGIEVTVE